MHLDVVDLKSFYYRTKLGRATKKAVQARLGEIWGESLTGETVVGFGFAAPFLRPALQDARRVISLMPGEQGVMPWPAGAENVSVLVEETQWPLAAGSADKIVVAHGLETCERPGALLDEIWRVLAPGGSAVFIVPNRAGMWARRDATPFGYGRPYSTAQLETQLKKHRFVPEFHTSALYALPSHRRFWLRAFPVWERVGVGLPGALIVEASKQIYVLPKGGAAEAIKSPLKVLGGLAAPAPKPVAGRQYPRLVWSSDS